MLPEFFLQLSPLSQILFTMTILIFAPTMMAMTWNVIMLREIYLIKSLMFILFIFMIILYTSTKIPVSIGLGACANEINETNKEIENEKVYNL